MNKAKMLIHLPITRFTYNSIKSYKIAKPNIIFPKSTVEVPKSGIDLSRYLMKIYNQK